ncbi:MAG: YfiR family protein [Acidobacteriota bacterium]|nr:YfiR family protein [Acidobacteriota bacterium]
MTGAFSRGAAALTLAALLAGTSATPSAQSAAVPDLQAAFLLNFARFTQWPASAQGQSIVMCVFDDDRLTHALARSLRGQTIEGRPLQAVDIGADGNVSLCQVLFVAKSSLGEGMPLLRAASRLPVLTVSDRKGFASTAGVVELFVEDGHMRFAVNIDVARRSQLTLSSRLLGLARIVRGTHAF